MIALLKKDFLTSRFIYLVTILIVIIGLIIVNTINPQGALIIALIASVLIPVIINKFTATEELRKNYDMLMNSFPIKRSDIVVSKYLYYLIQHIVTVVLLQGGVLFLNRGQEGVFITILLAQGAALIYFIFFIGAPNLVYYCFDYSTAMKYSSIITILAANAPIIITAVVKKINPNAMQKLLKAIEAGGNPIYNLVGMVIIGALVMYGAIIWISIKGYKRRDL